MNLCVYVSVYIRFCVYMYTSYTCMHAHNPYIQFSCLFTLTQSISVRTNVYMHIKIYTYKPMG